LKLEVINVIIILDGATTTTTTSGAINKYDGIVTNSPYSLCVVKKKVSASRQLDLNQ
jgi:hypothetical protein